MIHREPVNCVESHESKVKIIHLTEKFSFIYDKAERTDGEILLQKTAICKEFSPSLKTPLLKRLGIFFVRQEEWLIDGK